MNAILIRGPKFFDLNAVSKKPDYDSTLESLKKMNIEILATIAELYLLYRHHGPNRLFYRPWLNEHEEKKVREYIKKLFN